MSGRGQTLCRADARKIRAAVAAGAGVRETAREWGVSHSLVSRIAAGKRWAEADSEAIVYARCASGTTPADGGR